MKIRLERCGVAFEYERSLMQEQRFRALCLLAAGGIYAGMMCGVAALCGTGGVLVLAGLTAVIAMFASC